jgi:hypothetical protein
MAGPIAFLTTLEIHDGPLEAFKAASQRSMKFLEESGPQVMAGVCLDEANMRAHGFQVRRDSESILFHWKLADPHMRDVMQHATTRRVAIYGQPDEAVPQGLKRLAGQGTEVTVIPRFAGFDRFAMGLVPGSSD